MPCMHITINVIEACIPDYLTAKEIRMATQDNEHLVMVSEDVLFSWPLVKAEIQKELHPYLSFKAEISIIDGIAMKGRRIIVPEALHDKALKTATPKSHGNREDKAAGM